jgi:hypothetical protein
MDQGESAIPASIGTKQVRIIIFRLVRGAQVRRYGAVRRVEFIPIHERIN